MGKEFQSYAHERDVSSGFFIGEKLAFYFCSLDFCFSYESVLDFVSAFSESVEVILWVFLW